MNQFETIVETSLEKVQSAHSKARSETLQRFSDSLDELDKELTEFLQHYCSDTGSGDGKEVSSLDFHSLSR